MHKAFSFCMLLESEALALFPVHIDGSQRNIVCTCKNRQVCYSLPSQYQIDVGDDNRRKIIQGRPHTENTVLNENIISHPGR